MVIADLYSHEECENLALTVTLAENVHRMSHVVHLYYTIVITDNYVSST